MSVVTKYSFALTLFPNDRVAPRKLELEIRQSTGIIVSLLSATVDATQVTLEFKDSLPSSELTALNDLIAIHDGNPLDETDVPHNTDGRTIVHVTPRPLGTITAFTGSGDNQAAENVLWGDPTGQFLQYNHSLGDPTTETFYVDFNTVDNLTYIHSGYLQWVTAKFDTICAIFAPKVTPYSVSTNTLYNLVNGYLVVPAAGDGTIAINTADIKYVEAPLQEDGTRATAYWNATYDPLTDTWSDPVAAPLGDGRFNIFALEVPLATYMNYWQMLGDDSTWIASNDAAYFGHNTRLKFVAHTRGADHDWSFCGNLRLFRKKI